MATTVDLSAKYTTWISASAPATCYFGKTGYAAVSSGKMVTLIQFANPFPSGSTQNVTKATLTLKTRAVAGSVNLTIAQLTNPFTPARATWANTKQGSGFVVSQTRSDVNSANSTWTFDITPGMQKVASGSPLYGFIVTTTNPGTIMVQGNMGTALNPSLHVEYSQAPQPPSGLAPTAGRRIGTPTPVLRFVNTDRGGNTTLTACQVQVSQSSAFTQVLFDSGRVVTAIPQVDTGDLAGMIVLTQNATYWWRVRTQDGAGLWSDWSSPASFVYTALPTLSLANPDPGTPVVYDPTPPIDWRYGSASGSACSRWRVGIYQYQANGTTKLVAASGDQLGTATEWTPTTGLPKAGLYQCVVDVFDSYVDREATPYVRTYTSVSQDFTFATSATVAAPTGGTAVKANPVMPAVTLRWNRVDQPDGWRIYRDGVLVGSYAGTSLLVSGASDTYTWTDPYAPAGTHKWTVHPYVNKVVGKGLNIVATNGLTGTWLVNEDSGDMVCIVDDTDHQLTLPEQTQQVDVLGSQVPVTIVTALQGYAGKVDGTLVDQVGMPTGQDVASWHDRLLAFKGDVGQQYRLLGVGDLNLIVYVHNLTVSPEASNSGPVWTVTFDYVQADDFPVDL